MSTLKVNTIQDTTGNDALTIDSSGNVTASQGFVPSTQLSHRNLIINGGMDVWQRGTSFSSAGYTADRFRVSSGVSCSQSTDTPLSDFNYSLYLSTVNSSSYNLRYIVEDSYKRLSANNFTISFYMKGTSNFTGNVNIGGNTQGVSAQTFSVTTSWQRFELTFSNLTATTVPYGTANDYINFNTSVATPFYITGVQLEVGSVATPFEHRSYGEELARCQRYYEVIYSDGNGETIFSFDYNGSQNRIHWFYKVEKRTAPSFGLASGGSFDNSYTSISSSVSRTQVYHSSPTFLKSSAGTISAYVDAEL